MPYSESRIKAYFMRKIEKTVVILAKNFILNSGIHKKMQKNQGLSDFGEFETSWLKDGQILMYCAYFEVPINSVLIKKHQLNDFKSKSTSFS